MGSVTSSPAHRFWPARDDPRWPFAFLLTLYCVLGFSFFGFNRTPWQMLFILVSGAALDFTIRYFAYGKRELPLSAWISCASLAILLNYSKHSMILFLPVLLAIGGKYIFTFNGRHVFNPSMFGVSVSLLLGHELITAAPAYQWAGSSATVTLLLIAAAALLFLWRIDRLWLVASFVFFYVINTGIRAYIMRHHLPVEMLFIGTFTTPPFFLFSLYMITDPGTSPKSHAQQRFIGFAIASVDLLLHTKQSVYTFFYAALIVGCVRFFWTHAQAMWRTGPRSYFVQALGLHRSEPFYRQPAWRGRFAVVVVTLVYGAVALWQQHREAPVPVRFALNEVSAEQAGLAAPMGHLFDEVDPRVAHVAKWILSVGEAAAAADVDNDGDVDVFLTHALKAGAWRKSLYLNDTPAGGALHFSHFPVAALAERQDAKQFGVASGAVFADLDGDADQDLLVAYGFGQSRIYQNMLIERGSLDFIDISEQAQFADHGVSLQIVPFDMDNDDDLDLLVLHATSPWLTEYQPPRPLNIFNLPAAEYDGDRRMLRFMHDGWHNANNGGGQVFYENITDASGIRFRKKDVGVLPGRWSLAATTADFNHDGFVDVYVANDFGPDELLLNERGQRFVHVKGAMFNDVGNDTYKGMNASAADFDHNGFTDVSVSNVHHALQAEGSMLWMVSMGDDPFVPVFSDEATARNMLNEHRFGWGAMAGDLDNDGYMDLVQANGMVGDDLDYSIPEGPWYWKNRKDYWYVNHKLMQSGPEIHTYADMWGDLRGRTIYPHEARRVYLNQGAGAPGTFVDVATQVGLSKHSNSRGVVLSDFDNDGDLDVLITNQHEQPSLYQNDQAQRPDARAFIEVQLVGGGRNTDGLGARVEVRALHRDGTVVTQTEERRAVGGFSSTTDGRMHFGLGDNVSSVSVTATWPSGNKSGVEAQPNQRIVLREVPPTAATATPNPAPGATLRDSPNAPVMP